MFTNFIPVKVALPLNTKQAASIPSFAQTAFSLGPTAHFVFQVPVHMNITFFLSVGLHHYVKVKVNQSHYRTEVPRGFQEVKVPRLGDNGPEWW